MRRFDLLEPRSIGETCQILGEREDVKLVAGGTALLILIKQGLFVPRTLVNLQKVTGASEITYDAEKGLRIGALANIYDVETSAHVVQHYPVLARACHVVANIRIRNLATIGGNLSHADYQSDPPAALVALDARVELTSVGGTREVPIAEFLLGSYETLLEPQEVLSAVLLPPPPPNLRGTYLKFTTRSSEDRPCVGVTATVRMRDRQCEEVRLVVGAVSPVPVRVYPAEEMARGKVLEDDLIEKMAAEAAGAVDPIDDLRGPADYKRHVVRVISRRALVGCLSGGGK